jgi:hypothetical protein
VTDIRSCFKRRALCVHRLADSKTRGVPAMTCSGRGGSPAILRRLRPWLTTCSVPPAAMHAPLSPGDVGIGAADQLGLRAYRHPGQRQDLVAAQPHVQDAASLIPWRA